MSNIHIIRRAALVAALLIAAVAPARAITSCKVKVDKKTGLILVKARDLTAAPTWGGSASTTVNSFFNEAACVSGSSASLCYLADPATAAAKIPPPSCEVCVNDGATQCCRVPGCTPGVRDCTTVSVDVNVPASGDPFNTSSTATASCPVGYEVTGGGGRHTQSPSVFVTYSLPLSTTRPTADETGWSCTVARDSEISNLRCYARCCQLP